MFNRAFDRFTDPEPARVQRLVEALPAPLAALLRAALAEGHAVRAIESGFPAPPAGVLVLMSDALDPLLRDPPGEGLQRRVWSGYEQRVGYGDAKGHCWLMAPAAPADEASPAAPAMPATTDPAPRRTPEPTPDEIFRRQAVANFGGSPALRAWDASREMNYERWREGTGYDLDALRQMTPAERKSVEISLLHGLDNWRDVQALAALDTPRARTALLRLLREGTPVLRMAVLRHAPAVVAMAGEAVVVEALVAAIARADFFDGLTEALDEVARIHPPAVVEALWNGLAERPAPIAVHLAARLAFLAGLAAEPFDWSLRPFYLEFHTEDPAARAAAIEALRRRIADLPTPPAR